MLGTQSCTFPSCQQFHFYFKRVITFSDFQISIRAKAWEDLANFIHKAVCFISPATMHCKGWWSFSAQLIYMFPHQFPLRNDWGNIHIYIYIHIWMDGWIQHRKTILHCGDFSWCFSSSLSWQFAVWHVVSLRHWCKKIALRLFLATSHRLSGPRLISRSE